MLVDIHANLFFLVLLICRGVKASDTAADIKKAYRKAALRHHPDKVKLCFALMTVLPKNSMLLHLLMFLLF